VAQFILVDHSLKRLGGHHYDYALHVLGAAEKSGYQLTLATHRRFRKKDLPRPWRVHRVFRFDTYSPYAAYFSSRSRPIVARPAATRATATRKRGTSADSPRPGGGRLARILASLRQVWPSLDRWRRTRHFASACRRALAGKELTADDHVFFATLSEFDLRGLVRYLEADPRTRAANWHLQFHFNFLDGRDPEYDAQSDRLQQMREQFRDLLQRVPYHRLFFYNTSDELARQYNRLGVAHFQHLAYPIDRAFHDPQRQPPPGPIRVACGGGIRQEKGQQQLFTVIRDLWDEFFADGKVQLHVQSNKSWFQLPLPKAGATGISQAGPPTLRPATTDVAPVVYVPHPLSPSEYVHFIQQAGIGLMMYDSQRYYARRAGVLGEFLAAGVPVVVPAACWLAEQIAEVNFCYLDRIYEEETGARRLHSAHLPWNAGTYASGYLTFGGHDGPAATCFDCDRAERDVLVRFRWQRPVAHGTYVRLTVAGCDADGQWRSSRSAVVGHRTGQRVVSALFPLSPETTQVRITWQNAFHSTAIEIGQVEIQLMAAAVTENGHRPRGAVGLAAADPGDVAVQLREMLAHYGHYRRTAANFSVHWADRHHPRRTVAQLLARAATPTPAFQRTRAA
jgi:hypothetical protein